MACQPRRNTLCEYVQLDSVVMGQENCWAPSVPVWPSPLPAPNPWPSPVQALWWLPSWTSQGTWLTSSGQWSYCWASLYVQCWWRSWLSRSLPTQVAAATAATPPKKSPPPKKKTHTHTHTHQVFVQHGVCSREKFDYTPHTVSSMEQGLAASLLPTWTKIPGSCI